MSFTRFLAIACGVLLLSSCASTTSMFKGSSADPAGKLKKAFELYNSKDDPRGAEELIAEAIKDYQLESDYKGLAEAYRQYAIFYRSHLLNKHEKFYREKGFLDPSVKFDSRNEKAVEYFNLAKTIFEEYKDYGMLTDVLLSLAKTYDLMGKQTEACEALAKGKESHFAYRVANPEINDTRAEELNEQDQYMEMMKKYLTCP